MKKHIVFNVTIFALAILMSILFVALVPCNYALIIPGIIFILNSIYSIVLSVKNRKNFKSEAKNIDFFTKSN